MPRPVCQPCCNPIELSRAVDSYRAGVLITLCAILEAVGGGGGGVTNIRYDWEALCDPATGDPVFVRWEYTTDGVVAATTAYNPDGTAYVGVIADLVSCGGGSSPSLVEATYDPLSVTGFAAIMAVLTAITILTSAAREVSFWNDTDVNLVGSWDGVNDHFIIPSRGTRTFSYAALGLMETGPDVFIRYETGAPTNGNLYIDNVK